MKKTLFCLALHPQQAFWMLPSNIKKLEDRGYILRLGQTMRNTHIVVTDNGREWLAEQMV